MDDNGYEILEALESAKRNLSYIIGELEGKSRYDDRLDDVIHGCHDVLDSVDELAEEYADRARADEDREDVYMMEDAS